MLGPWRGLRTRTYHAFQRYRALGRRAEEAVRKGDSLETQVQLLLTLEYQRRRDAGLPLPRFSEVGFQSFSQNHEDGILLYIFSLIGVTNKRVVEMCCSDGIECNAANLIIHHGWEGLLFDGDAAAIEVGRKFYAQRRDTGYWPPKLAHAWITAENVNALIRDNGFEGEIDLLSLDMDGVDYWVWRAMTVVRPRVVVAEYNTIWGPDEAVTVPYRPDFTPQVGPPGIDSGGVSLAALVKLGREKGYRLVGCEKYNFNAFFVRSDIGADVLPEVPAATCFEHPRAAYLMTQRRPLINAAAWVAV